jgi:hypothetical protein
MSAGDEAARGRERECMSVSGCVSGCVCVVCLCVCVCACVCVFVSASAGDKAVRKEGVYV